MRPRVEIFHVPNGQEAASHELTVKTLEVKCVSPFGSLVCLKPNRLDNIENHLQGQQRFPSFKPTI
jgi:hypothetical protein